MAAPTVTSKLGLIVDPDGESLIGTSDANWGKVDTAAGVQTVDAGQSAPLPFAGALVAERLNGIGYTLVDNGAGGWNKRYITYPYVYCAYTSARAMAYSSGSAMWGWETFDPNNSINSTAAEKGAGNTWVCPRKGIYNVSQMSRWTHPTPGFFKVATLFVNGGEQYNVEDRKISLGIGTTTMQVKFTTIFNQGDIVCGGFQNYAPNSQDSMYTSVWISMLGPVT